MVTQKPAQKGVQIGDDMILYRENPKDLTKT